MMKDEQQQPNKTQQLLQNSFFFKTKKKKDHKPESKSEANKRQPDSISKTKSQAREHQSFH